MSQIPNVNIAVGMVTNVSRHVLNYDLFFSDIKTCKTIEEGIESFEKLEKQRESRKRKVEDEQ